jgi:hypothetical protein
MISQPLPHSPHWSRIGRRHIYLFVQGIRAPSRALGQHISRTDVGMR